MILGTAFPGSIKILNRRSVLFIHKNTLVYRLSLIKELLHTDLSNALKNLELFNSILLYDYLHAV